MTVTVSSNSSWTRGRSSAATAETWETTQCRAGAGCQSSRQEDVPPAGVQPLPVRCRARSPAVDAHERAVGDARTQGDRLGGAVAVRGREHAARMSSGRGVSTGPWSRTPSSRPAPRLLTCRELDLEPDGAGGDAVAMNPVSIDAPRSFRVHRSKPGSWVRGRGAGRADFGGVRRSAWPPAALLLYCWEHDRFPLPALSPRRHAPARRRRPRRRVLRDRRPVWFCLFDDEARRHRAPPRARRSAPVTCSTPWSRRRRRRPPLRPARRRPLGPGRRPPPQRAQAAARPATRPPSTATLRLGPGRLRPRHERARDRRDDTDSAAAMPRSVVADRSIRLGADDRAPAAPRWRTRSSTRCTSRASRRRTPTCPRRSAAPTPASRHPAAIKHLTDLGVTAVELLPVAPVRAGQPPRGEGPPQLLGLQLHRLLRPARRVRVGGGGHGGGQVARVQSRWSRPCTRPASRSWLDVVYNHTAEGNHMGPTLSFKGIDNAAYYRLVEGEESALLRHDRHGQQPERRPPGRARPDHGQPALLGDRDARRRLPLRPRDDADPPGRRGQRAQRVPHADPPGPGACRASR